MRKSWIIYGLILASLIILLKVAEYSFIIRRQAIDIYIGLIALLFTLLGIAAGRKFTRPKEIVVEKHIPVTAVPTVQIDTEDALQQSGLSKRELEVLVLMAEGLSNQEIAERTFVSIHTIKTHVSNILLKLDAKRRTQAVLKAREMGVIS